MQQQRSQMATQIPEDIARLAHEQQLGAPQANYTIMQLRRGWRWARFIFLFSILIFILALTLLFTNMVLDSSAFLIFVIPLVIAYALFLAGLLAWGLTHKFCAIYPCDNGLIFKRSITKHHIIHWDEIEAIWQGSARSYP